MKIEILPASLLGQALGVEDCANMYPQKGFHMKVEGIGTGSRVRALDKAERGDATFGQKPAIMCGKTSG